MDRAHSCPAPADGDDAVRLGVRHALVSGALASLLSAAALVALGRREAGAGAAPVNAVSHWYWGDEALRRNRTDVMHTAVGYATHHGASTFWAALQAWATLRWPQLRRSPRARVATSAATSAIACFVDFQLTPHRLTPGYEHRLSKPALGVVYAAFAVGLALGTAAVFRQHDRPGDDRR